jgi:DNA-directed RNA polymerase specialized sigma24 family protein
MTPDALKSHYAAVRSRLTANTYAPPKAIPVPEPEPEPEPVNILAGLPRIAGPAANSIRHLLVAYGATWRDLRMGDRRYTSARRAVMWMLTLRGWSSPEIARVFGTDHTTILYHLFAINIWAHDINKPISARKRAMLVKYRGL